MRNDACVFTAATLVALLFSPDLGRAQQTPFSLEQIMSSPFPQGLTAAPAGGAVAWVFNARGVRNIWTAQPPSYKAQAITAYADDDGQDIGDLTWTPDGKAIVYTRGGDMEMGREYPNPRSFPQGVEQDVWLIALAGGQPKRLGEGHSPAVSPKGGSVAFIYKNQVWLAKIEGSEKAVQLIHSRGESDSLRWSPEGSKLAFVSRRGDHSLVGVYDLSSNTLHYLDPGVDRDFTPVWSPDGKQIAFIRIPASKEAFEFGPKRTGQPWSIRVADVATGVGHQAWMAQEGRGSVFRGIVGESDLYWAAEGRLVFPWEKDGWTHLYSIPASGGKAELLTPGDYEVEDVALSPNRQEILFSSNQNDIDRRHIWRAAVTGGGPPTAATMGKGIEWSPVVTSDGKAVILLRSDARRPALPAIIAGAAELRDLTPDAFLTDFPCEQLVEPQQVIFPGADGMPIHAQLFLHKNAGEPTRHSAVVFFHGGSRRQMLLGWHYMSYYHNAYAMNQYLASLGYVVLSVNYRSGIGYGMEFREALNYGATGASEFNDVLGAGLYLRSRPDVDPKRIGLWGGSYGGYLTALGLARASDLFAAGVDFHGVHDWNLEIPNFVPAYDPTKSPDAARLAYESSPIASVKTWRSPVLLIHGDDDRNVPFSETVQLVEALRKQGVECHTLVFPDEIHDFLTYARWLEAYHAAADFLDGKLQH
jgi:dipeptidyl aminopeptidase/acylaminoacyl peptidase